MSEVEKLVERLKIGCVIVRGTPGGAGETAHPSMIDRRATDVLLSEAAATLQSQARRVEELEGALRSAHVQAENAVFNLSQAGSIYDRDDCARAFQAIAECARSALSEGSGSSRELAHPDESGDACGATERAEG